MDAYAMIDDYQKDFSTSERVKTIKAQKITDFSNLPWAKGTLSIPSGKALFLYGGRDALANALANMEGNSISSSSILALFRAQRPVAMGFKEKQLLMITKVPEKMQGKLLSRCIGAMGFSDLISLRALILVIKELELKKD